MSLDGLLYASREFHRRSGSIGMKAQDLSNQPRVKMREVFSPQPFDGVE